MRTFEMGAGTEPGGSRPIKRDTTLSVELFSEYNLWKDMQRAELEEDYQLAKTYKDELIKRGKLQAAATH
jgi:hypothetical protein